MSSPDPSVAVCEGLAALIDDEFSAEGWTAGFDRFGRSKGMGEPHDQASISVTPESERPRPGRIIELQVPVVVQFYLGYDAEPDETITRDSREIAALAGRFRRMLAGDAVNLPDGAWYVRLGDIDYPLDPTGNKTRFEARVEGIGANAAALPA